MIPKVIHQIWLQGYENIPAVYKAYHDECKKINADFEFMFWDDNKINDLLTQFYPTYLELYHSYTIPAQKADCARYFIIYHFGGIYLDLDMKCIKNLTEFLQYDFFCTTYFNVFHLFFKDYFNGVFGAFKKHPVFECLFEEMKKRLRYKKIIFYSTGPIVFYDAIQSFYKKNQDYTFTVFDSKYLHPCSVFSNELECAKKCKDCYVVHLNLQSWSIMGRLIQTMKKFIFRLN